MFRINHFLLNPAYCYLPVFFQTGDEMSKRAKFVLVTWVGPGVSVMKKAKMSTDKALMKDICQVIRQYSQDRTTHFDCHLVIFPEHVCGAAVGNPRGIQSRQLQTASGQGFRSPLRHRRQGLVIQANARSRPYQGLPIIRAGLAYFRFYHQHHHPFLSSSSVS